MGQVIRLVFPDSGYPATMQELDAAECVFLLAVRWWVAEVSFVNEYEYMPMSYLRVSFPLVMPPTLES